MKISIIFSLLISLFIGLIIFCSFLKKPVEYEISPAEKSVNAAMARNSKTLAKKYHMRPFAISVAMPVGNIKYLELKFQAYGPLLKEEIRKLLVDSAKDFLSDINADSELCFYLKNHSLTMNDIGITLFLIDSSGRDLDDPYIGIAKISKGELTYDTLIIVYDTEIKMDLPKYKSKNKETYEEALNILNS